MVYIRRDFLSPALAAVFGIIGAVLRRIEVKTVIDPVTGLAKPWQAVTVALALFSVLAVIIIATISMRFKKLEVGADYKSTMLNDSGLMFVLSILAAAGVAVGSVLYYFEYKNIFAAVLAIFGLAASLSVLYVSRKRSNSSSEGDSSAFFTALFVIFVCLLMVLEYKARSADPVLIDYVYDFLALCSAAMAFYYKAGYAFERPKPMQTMMFMPISAFFCIVSAAGSSGYAQSVLFVSLALLLVRDMIVLEDNLKLLNR